MAKIEKLTKLDANAFSGYWKLPSGKPGLFATAGDIGIVLVSDGEITQFILMDENDDTYFSEYVNEYSAVKDFEEAAENLNEFTDSKKLIDKYKLK